MIMQEIIVKDVPERFLSEAVEVFTFAFVDDPLFQIAFPEYEKRIKMTRIMYEFVVCDMVRGLNLSLKGAYAEGELAGCIIFSTPQSYGWSDTMMGAVMKMREKANDERIDIIGQYARLEKYDPGVEHYYGNELAVKKEYRKMGIGKKLADFMINKSLYDPLSKGVLIDTANEDNVRLYEKWGWKLMNVKEFYGIKAYSMWLEI